MSAPQKIGPYEIHPAAQLFPMMEEAELADLAESIGQGFDPQHPIVLLDGQILDGRNRALVLERLGVGIKSNPDFTREATATEEADAVEFVLRENLRRRHLTPSQRAAIAAEAQLLVEEERAKARQREHGGTAPGRPANTQRPGALTDAAAEGAAEEPSAALPADGQSEERAGSPTPARSSSSPAPKPPKGKAAARVAAIAGVGARSVERAKAVKERSPELFEKVKAGDVTLKRAEKDLRKAQQLEQVAEYRPPAGEYPVIVTDPAWPYEDQLEGDGARGATPYPQATLEAIKAQVPPMAKDCVVFLWCTNQHLIDLEAPVHQVLRAWGLTPKALITWKKDRMGLGKYVRNITEQCVMAIRGRPVLNLTDETTCIEAPRGAHSAKPDEFFARVEGLCPARPLLELEARGERKGWVTSGAELPAAPEGRAVDPLAAATTTPFAGEPRCRVCGCTENDACAPDATGNTCAWEQGPDANPLCSRCVGKKAPTPDQARFFDAALNHYRNGLSLCPWCGIDEERNQRESGALGWLHGGVKDGRFGLSICGRCNRKGRPQFYVDQKHRHAWLRAFGLPVRTRRAHARMTAPAAAADPIAFSEFRRLAGELGFSRTMKVAGKNRQAMCFACNTRIPFRPTKHGDVEAGVLEQLRQHQADCPAKRVREVKVNAGSYREGRGGGQCVAEAGRKAAGARCSRTAKAAVKGAGRLWSVCTEHGQQATRGGVLRVSLEEGA